MANCHELDVLVKRCHLVSAGHVLGESVVKAESLVTQRTQPLGPAWTGRVQSNALEQRRDDTT